mgnify:CR=1 FL=1
MKILLIGYTKIWIFKFNMTKKPKFSQADLDRLCKAANNERSIKITNMIAKHHSLQPCNCGPNRHRNEGAEDEA